MRNTGYYWDTFDLMIEFHQINRSMSFSKGDKMDDPGHLIALYFTLLYIIFGPVLLMAIYVLFDSLYLSGRPSTRRHEKKTGKNDPSLWTGEDINAHMNRI
jgi:hypothetical protein